MSLFKLVAAKYPKEKIGRHLPDVNSWIAEHAPFDLSEAESDALWGVGAGLSGVVGF